MESNSISVFGFVLDATWVIALATVVYTFGTLALWWTTNRNLKAARDAFKLNFLLGLFHIDEIARREMAGSGPSSVGPRLMGALSRRKNLELLKRTFPKDYEALVTSETELKKTES